MKINKKLLPKGIRLGWAAFEKHQDVKLTANLIKGEIVVPDTSGKSNKLNSYLIP